LRLRLRLTQRREVEALEGLRALCAASRIGLEATLETLGDRLRRLDTAVEIVAVFEADLSDLTCTFAFGSRAELLPGLRIAQNDLKALPAVALRDGRCVAGFRGESVLLANDRAAIAMPLVDADRLWAVVYAGTLRGAFADPPTLAEAIGRAALPYALARERERDRASATFDGLTGLLTPHAFRERLHDEIAAMPLRGGAYAALLFIDTDEFKSINDSLGHGAGDGVLRAMAGLLRSYAVPDLDVLARNGGDEFCALLRDTPKSRAIERARKICAAVRSHDFFVGRAITASIGVAAYPFDATTSSSLLELADAAMYHSKRSGRDRASYVVAPDRFASS
jgi:diguanylate cyclase (GGDEF)-like protein